VFQGPFLPVSDWVQDQQPFMSHGTLLRGDTLVGVSVAVACWTWVRGCYVPVAGCIVMDGGRLCVYYFVSSSC
jgi:hypothetical protein